MVLEWREPEGKSSIYRETVNELKDRPDEWAVVALVDSYSATKVWRSSLRRIDPRVQVVVRKIREDKVEVFARWYPT